MKLNANENKYIFPYLFDDTQDIAKKYDAACTPDFFLYDKELKLVYRGNWTIQDLEMESSVMEVI